MSPTTRRILQTSVIVDCAIPEGMTIEEYRRSRTSDEEPRRRTWKRVKVLRGARV
jgi:hypothetical protein